MSTNTSSTLITDLGGRGEKILNENLSSDEKILIKIKGAHGEAFVATNKRIYVLKWGFMAGSTFGGRCIAFEYHSVTGLEYKKGILTGSLEVLSPATQNTQKDYWSASNSTVSSDNIVTFQRDKYKIFEEATKEARELLHKHRNGSTQNQENDTISQLEKLAAMKDKGVITDDEFQTMKKKILS